MSKYLVTRTDGTPIPADEPCFVLRAQDALAPATIERYMELAMGINAPIAFLSELEAHRLRVLEWQRAHKRKLPD